MIVPRSMYNVHEDCSCKSVARTMHYVPSAVSYLRPHDALEQRIVLRLSYATLVCVELLR